MDDNSKRIGLVTGKFAPLHTGHLHLINKAATMVDVLYVVLSYDEFLYPGDKVLTLKNRMRWLKTCLAHLPHAVVTYVKEDGMPSYPDGWTQWAEAVQTLLRQEPYNVAPHQVDKIFSSEPEYTEGFKTHWPQATHVVVDHARTMVPVSASKIRENPYKYWGYLPPIVRANYVKRVCFIGTESCGKTTLSRSLASMFNTEWVEEYGRVFCERELMMDETLLQQADYGLLAARRYELEHQATLRANRVLFVDTNAFITNFYSYLYDRTYNALVHEYEKIERYDITFIMSDDVPWVEDGLRKNTDRKYTSQAFAKALRMAGDNKFGEVHEIRGDYEQRMSAVLSTLAKAGIKCSY